MDSGIASVLNAAKIESTGVADHMLAETTMQVPTPQEMIETEVRVQSAPNSPGPTRKRGRPKGSRSSSPAPDQMSGEDRTRAYVQRLGMSQAEDTRAVLLRKKITKIFDYFPHKLSRYFPGPPDVVSMSVQQLIDTEKLVLNIIDEADESVYVKEGFKWVAGVIENAGPSIHRKLLRWCPGADILQHQTGLSNAVATLVDEPGSEGLADEL